MDEGKKGRGEGKRGREEGEEGGKETMREMRTKA